MTGSHFTCATSAALLAASLSTEAPPWAGPLPPPPPPRLCAAHAHGEEDNWEDEEIGRALQDALGGHDECSYDEYYYASPVSQVSKETDSEEMDSEEEEEEESQEVDQEKDEQVVDEEKEKDEQVVDEEKEGGCE